jgi:hypothetical protein
MAQSLQSIADARRAGLCQADDKDLEGCGCGDESIPARWVEGRVYPCCESEDEESEGGSKIPAKHLSDRLLL